jgi:IS1 family transposase
VFSSDGLALYFYAITAHFGAWVQAANERHRIWCVDARLLYAQVVKRYRRHRLTEVRRHVLLGQPEAFRQALMTHGFSGRVQTAFIERLNLTVRRSLASLARRSWSTVRSTQDLALQFEWWRAIYHFVKPHHSLRWKIASPAGRLRYRSRTPAQAAGLTRRRWSVLEVLNYPAPPAALG